MQKILFLFFPILVYFTHGSLSLAAEQGKAVVQQQPSDTKKESKNVIEYSNPEYQIENPQEIITLGPNPILELKTKGNPDLTVRNFFEPFRKDVPLHSQKSHTMWTTISTWG